MKQIYYRYSVAVCLLLAGVSAAFGQISNDSDTAPGELAVNPKTRKLQTTLNPWLLTNNAAGLSILPIENTGMAQFLGEFDSGDYHRAQEGDRTRRFRFDADMYTNLNEQIYLYGRFGIDINRQYDKSWSDVIDPYQGNPYGYGSARSAFYDTEAYELQALIASRQINGFRFGLGLEYSAAEFVRLRDPRPRTLSADYALKPGMTYSFGGAHTFGLDGYYHFRRQAMIGIKTYEEDRYSYYVFSGLDNFEARATGTFEREFEEKTFGGDIQYFYQKERLSTLISIGYEEAVEKILEKEESPGRYSWKKYSAALALNAQSGRMLHSGHLKFSYMDSWADYYIQEQININDGKGNNTKIWVNIYEALAYKYYRTCIDGQYRMYRTSTRGYDWYVGVSGSMYGFEDEYLVPHSERKVSVFDGSIDFGGDIARGRKGGALFIEGSLKARLPGKNELQVSDENMLYENVLLPDMGYYKAKAFGGSLCVRYDFNMRVRKSMITPYVKVYGSSMRAKVKEGEDNNRVHWSGLGIALGLNLK